MLVTNEKACFSNLGCWTELYNFSLIKLALDQRSTWNSSDQLLFCFRNALIDTKYNSMRYFLSHNSSLLLTSSYIKCPNCGNVKYVKYIPNEQS